MGISSTHGTLSLLFLRKGYSLILCKDFFFIRVRPHTLCVCVCACDHPQSPDRGLLIITLIPNRQSQTYSSHVWRVLGIPMMPTANLEKNKISVQTCCSCVWRVLDIPMMQTASLENYKTSVQMYSSCVWRVLGIPMLPTASLEKNKISASIPTMWLLFQSIRSLLKKEKTHDMYVTLCFFPLVGLYFAAHPLLWAPKWFGLLVLPVLTLLVPYVVYQVSVNDSRLQGHG